MEAAERIAEYLKQCGVFYLATLDGIWPRLRPMNNVCVCGGVIPVSYTHLTLPTIA